jgi:hypothetical protein
MAAALGAMVYMPDGKWFDLNDLDSDWEDEAEPQPPPTAAGTSAFRATPPPRGDAARV